MKNEEIEERGAFVSSLQRNNKQIKDDRARDISEDAELSYKRAIEDMQMYIKKMKREQESMLDLSPTDKMTLILASDFDGVAYAKKDIDLGVKIRNEEIRCELAIKRFEYLFGNNPFNLQA